MPTSNSGTPTKPEISVSFHNFHRIFDPPNSFFVKALTDRFTVTIERTGRDVQISSVFGQRPLPTVPGRRPLRVWWTGEAQDPRGTIFDLHFGFQPSSILGKRWFRYPLWIAFIDWWNPAATTAIGRLLGPRRLRAHTGFCSFIFSNTPSIRSEFFLRLNELQPVASFGRHLNNTGRRLVGREELLAAIAQHRFNIAFENQTSPGYVTEKLVDPLMVGSIPIYWGAHEALMDFNPAAFIYANEFASLDALARHVVKLAQSEDALAEIAAAPAFPGNAVPYEHRPTFFADRIAEALSGTADVLVPERWNLSGFIAARNPRREIRPFKRAASLIRRMAS